jgi:DNA-binding PucR family transcriptional regulator
MRETGVGLGQLVLALDATLVRLVEAPRGLDRPVRSAALIDADDVRLGLAVGAGSADVFFLLGISDPDATHWLDRQIAAHGPPAAIFAKEPSDAVVARAVAAGTAVVAVDPKARWERLYRLVNHVFEHRRTDSVTDTGTDLFALAQSIADRTHGMVSIEDAQSHVLAYSASNEEADELRRLSILGRAGPPEHLRWIAQWGIFDRLRAGTEVVAVDERPELGLRPRLAIGIHRQDAPGLDGRPPPRADGPHRHPAAGSFSGTIWVQQGSRELADDAEEILRGAAVLAARIMARLAARPSAHLLAVQQLLGLADTDEVDLATLARELGVAIAGRAAVIGFVTDDAHPRMADVLALSASAFRPDAQVAANGARVYVVLPDSGRTAAVVSWIRGTIGALHTELGLALRAVIAAPIAGLAAVAGARREIDRVFDSAQRHPVSIGQVTTLAEARTTVLLDEIVTLVAAEPRLVDPRVRRLREAEPVLAETLRVYLDAFGDVAAAAAALHVHPNTIRYRVRRVEQVLSTTLADPDVRLLLSLSLRATA